MRLIPILIIALAFCISGCKKEDSGSGDPGADCAQQQYAEITIRNNTNDPYIIYISGIQTIRIQANSQATRLKISEGYKTFRAVQESGFIFTPTEYTTAYSVSICDDLSWSFP